MAANLRHPRALLLLVCLALLVASSCAAVPRPSSVAGSPAAIRPSPTDADGFSSSAPTPLPSLCPTPTLAPPAAVLDSEPGLLAGYSWSDEAEGVDATGVVPDAVQFRRSIQATPQERLTVGIVGDCPVTEWSVRAIDPVGITAVWQRGGIGAGVGATI